jgi:purine-binding chemotaxis protein CheW
VQALLLPVGADRYALELAGVHEVVRAPVLTPLPGAPRAALGVMNLRGDVVPVLDTAALLGVGRLAAAPFAVVAAAEAGLAALAADGEPATVVLDGPAGPAELPAALGRFAVDGAIVTLLDLGAVLAPERTSAP